jgi:hypothetical protein
VFLNQCWQQCVQYCASRTAANGFDAKWRINTCYAHEYTMLAPAQLWRNWWDGRPSNQADIDSNVTDILLYGHGHGHGPDFYFVFVP